MDSNSGGEIRRPETAVRSGVKATLGLSPSPSMTAARNAASMAGAVHVDSDARTPLCSSGTACSAGEPAARTRTAFSATEARASSETSTLSSGAKHG